MYLGILITLQQRVVGVAVGAQLDVLGRIVGEARLGDPDANYRLRIKAGILLNVSSGTPEELLAIFRLLTSDLPSPSISDFLSREASRSRYAAGTEFLIARIDMVANTGTYVDSPFHRYPDGIDLAEVPLDRLADLDALVVDVSDGRTTIGVEVFADKDVTGKAVLVRTARRGGDAVDE